ncbi:MAG: hypothetical protein ABIZ72_10035, partial [Candidatus Limnocylindrales bacterium]
MGPLSPRPGRGRCARGRSAAITAASTGAILLLAGLGSGSAVLAADGVTFGNASATSSFGVAIEFKQPVTLATAPRRVEILLTTPGSIGPAVVPLPAATGAGASTLEYRVDLSDG